MILRRSINSTSYYEDAITKDSILINDQFEKNETFNQTYDYDECYEDQAAAEEYCLACTLIPIMLFTCFIAMLVNIVVISSACWIRSPMTPNLKISLSLAAADACSSTMYSVSLINQYIDYTALGVFPYIVELLRLSGIVITAVHLLAAALNHYIGILKPLHYNAIVTSKKVSAVIWFLWLCPAVLVFSICFGFDTEGTLWEDILTNTNTAPRFFSTFGFRLTYTLLFFIPILIMVICYTHILMVVKKQQTRWNNLSRVGSTRTKGKPCPKISRERKQLESNVRAIYTTLLILGSCFIGWTPALLWFTLTCELGCYIEGNEVTKLNCTHGDLVRMLRLLDNILIILKMLANPIIYSIRMKEIKDGTHGMFFAVKGLFCRSRRNAFESSGHYYRSRMRNSTGTSGGTIQIRMTSFKSNKSGDHIISGKDENTLL